MNSIRTFVRLSRAGTIAGLAALVATAAVPAAASVRDPDTATSTTARAAKKQDIKKDRMVCVEAELTGSRLPRKMCKTRDQWISEDGFDPILQR